MKVKLIGVHFESYDKDKNEMSLFFKTDLKEMEKISKLIGKEFELIIG